MSKYSHTSRHFSCCHSVSTFKDNVLWSMSTHGTLGELLLGMMILYCSLFRGIVFLNYLFCISNYCVFCSGGLSQLRCCLWLFYGFVVFRRDINNLVFRFCQYIPPIEILLLLIRCWLWSSPFRKIPGIAAICSANFNELIPWSSLQHSTWGILEIMLLRTVQHDEWLVIIPSLKASREVSISIVKIKTVSSRAWSSCCLSLDVVPESKKLHSFLRR